MLRQIMSLQALSTVKKTSCFFLDTFNNNLYRDISLDEFKHILKYNMDVFDNIDDDRIEKKFKTIKMLESNIDWTKHKRRRRSKRFLSIKLILKMTKRKRL
jgi:hypothetical protein